ncbi:MAG: hypothetical protein ACO3N7_05490 [Kiritimatiellia bacterium]
MQNKFKTPSAFGPLSAWKRLGLAFFISALVWILYSWPLPLYWNEGIPSSSTNIEKYSTRTLVKGDQLQLNYFYWLFSDMLKGETPFFHNLYEFNTGDDAERYRVANYNIPLSFIYAGWDALGNRAFAWNMSLYTTVFLSYWLTWIYLFRLTRREGISMVAALVSISLPFRSMKLLGGSPIGMAMLWVPIIILGLDLAVRDRRWLGGIMATLGIYAAFWNDTRIFYFCVLTSPVWCFYAFIQLAPSLWKSPKWWKQVLARLLPFAGMVLWMFWEGLQFKNKDLANTNLRDGRDILEINNFSPSAESLFAWRAYGIQSHAYIGYSLVVLLGMGLAFCLWRIFWKKESQLKTPALLTGISAAMAVIVVCMALGMNGPFDGLVFRAARALLPGYKLIRMTIQSYGILPHVLSVAVAMMLCMLVPAHLPPKKAFWLTLGIGAVLFTDHAAQVRATICLLPEQQGAYAAVAAHAEETAADKRVIVLPIWPGDSDWASIYQYYVSLYRIRMINGYSPVLREDYVRDIFGTFGPFNSGTLSDAALDDLIDRNTRYLLLHEDAFPEKVSPFPVGFTLKRLLNHPRLEKIGHDQNVWAFHILEEAREVDPVLSELNTFFPTLHWEFEHPESELPVEMEKQASGNHYRRLGTGDLIETTPFKPWQAPDGRLLLRVRGQGEIELADSRTQGPGQVQAVDSKEWIWIPLSWEDLSGERTPRFQVNRGQLDLDCMLYTAGTWVPPAPGETLRLPAALFFHAGYLDPQSLGVHLRVDYEAADRIWYGPMLPLDAGTYEIALSYESAAPAGTLLGRLHVRKRYGQYDSIDVVAGDSAVIPLDHPENLLLRAEFEYTRNADMELLALEIRRRP